ncbi:unnamed protein product [Dibothriocephalus latus]|uniref:Membrane insertase YidC/Oxa/ALB C-terminal domain-containing protein n=1 Tax=Dibothriocephalus latus TaxID=60516 RepID=A0A3P7LGC7_DIBLA|nr:unnamed protein product [Dibothriocephalus latus]
MAIASTTLVIRLCLFPLIIDQRRKLASYTNAMPKIMALQDRMTKARISSNYIEMMQVSQQMQHLMKTEDINPLRSMRLMIVQVPLFLSVFAGLRGMAALPVVSMQTGGLAWFTDLTLCDPFYILPLYSMTSIFLMFEVPFCLPSLLCTCPFLRFITCAFKVSLRERLNKKESCGISFKMGKTEEEVMTIFMFLNVHLIAYIGLAIKPSECITQPLKTGFVPTQAVLLSGPQSLYFHHAAPGFGSVPIHGLVGLGDDLVLGSLRIIRVTASLFCGSKHVFITPQFGADVSSQNMTPTIKTMMRIFPVVGFFMIMHMPAVRLLKLLALSLLYHSVPYSLVTVCRYYCFQCALTPCLVVSLCTATSVNECNRFQHRARLAKRSQSNGTSSLIGCRLPRAHALGKRLNGGHGYTHAMTAR